MKYVLHCLALSLFILPYLTHHLEAKADDIITAEISIGELVDKITVLEIKTERIKDQAKLKNVQTELNSLNQTFYQDVQQTKTMQDLKNQLKTINEKLWTIEDDIRNKERYRAFDQEFIELARSVYYTNDLRCEIKRKINNLAGSHLVEEKSYSDYATPVAKK